MLLNKKLHDIDPYNKTIVQLLMAGVIMVPYSLICENLTEITFSPLILAMALVLIVFHTGISFTMFFGAVGHMSAQSIAILSYIDPVLSVLLSAIVLKEKLGVLGWIGAVLILGAACTSELNFKHHKNEDAA